MRSTMVHRVWRSALALCLVFSLVAAIAHEPPITPARMLPCIYAVFAGTQVPSESMKKAAAQQQATSGTSTRKSSGVADILRLRARDLTIPVLATSAAQLTDTYMQARPGGATHQALDIMAPRGTPVLAVDDGRVAKLFLSKQGGVTLYQFDADAEYVYYYAHLDRYADGVTEGGSLRKGQVIGYVGTTGNASVAAPHLHFATLRLGPERQWWRGSPINPFLIWRTAQP